MKGLQKCIGVLVLIVVLISLACGGASTPTPVPTDTPVPPTDTPVPPTDTPVPPTKTPTPEKTELEWQDVTNEAGGFVVSMPEGKVKEEKDGDLVTVGVELDNIAFMIMYADLEFAVEPDQVKTFFDKATEGAVGENGKLVSSKDGKVGQYPSREVVIQKGKQTAYDKMILVDKRLYQLIAGGVEVSEDNIDKFWSSFELLETPAESSATVAPTATPAKTESSSDVLAPQTGRCKLFLFNEYKEELTFTINGKAYKIPTGGFDKMVTLDMDAGKYTYTISIPGGAVNDEVEMTPNQSWSVGVRADGAVYKPNKVYPD